MAKMSHRRGEVSAALHRKTDWLRRRPSVDLDVVETLELAADVIERLEVRTNAGYARIESQLDRLRAELAKRGEE